MVNIIGNSNLHLSFTVTFSMHQRTGKSHEQQGVQTDITITGKIGIITEKIGIITGIIFLLLRFNFHRN